MMMSSVEFFRSLPPKQCTKCGNVLNEMHESYVQQCEECSEELVTARK
ncbi:protein YhfH [Alkalicoccus urumqiensis]|uniref:YhfH family protein n=1 Tax=Alkalicoccus urumqiensis TaxID=1548213 RepID=A0A2P6MDS8_ALKUR|nr:protein YhfH [Alkalicoccus urumqiensis]PRO64439.1 YhfH family protein [Alkalicoccus urumqiensis]